MFMLICFLSRRSAILLPSHKVKGEVQLEMPCDHGGNRHVFYFTERDSYSKNLVSIVHLGNPDLTMPRCGMNLLLDFMRTYGRECLHLVPVHAPIRNKKVVQFSSCKRS